LTAPTAKELLPLGRPVAGQDAAAWGMIHRAVPTERPDRRFAGR